MGVMLDDKFSSEKHILDFDGRVRSSMALCCKRLQFTTFI